MLVIKCHMTYLLLSCERDVQKYQQLTINVIFSTSRACSEEKQQICKRRFFIRTVAMAMNISYWSPAVISTALGDKTI